VILRLAVGVLLLFVIACSNDSPPKGDQFEFDVKVLKNDAAIADFVNRHPEWPVIKYARADLNNDGRKDVVIIYRIAKDTNRMRVVLDIGGKYSDTNDVFVVKKAFQQTPVFKNFMAVLKDAVLELNQPASLKQSLKKYRKTELTDEMAEQWKTLNIKFVHPFDSRP